MYDVPRMPMTRIAFLRDAPEVASYLTSFVSGSVLGHSPTFDDLLEDPFLTQNILRGSVDDTPGVEVDAGNGTFVLGETGVIRVTFDGLPRTVIAVHAPYTYVASASSRAYRTISPEWFRVEVSALAYETDDEGLQAVYDEIAGLTEGKASAASVSSLADRVDAIAGEVEALEVRQDPIEAVAGLLAREGRRRDDADANLQRQIDAFGFRDEILVPYHAATHGQGGVDDITPDMIGPGRIMAAIKPFAGPGSQFDADTVDGLHAAAFLRKNLEGAGDTGVVPFDLTEDPANGSKVVRRSWVENFIARKDPKENVVTASGGNITLANLQTVSGVALVEGDRVLVKNQSNPRENGIWDANIGSWARSFDANTSDKLTSGAFTYVSEGTLAGTSWQVTTPDPITLGTTNIVWGQYSGPGTISAGAGLTRTGNQLSVLSKGITNAMLALNAVTHQEVAAANRDGAVDVPSMRTLGTGGQQAVAGDDPRLSDARVPTLHAHPSTQITHSPAGNISSNTVQAAINELDTEKQPVGSYAPSVHSHPTHLPPHTFPDALTAIANPHGFRIREAQTLTEVWADLATASTSGGVTFSLRRNGTEVATVTVLAGQTLGVTTGLSVALAIDDRMTVVCTAAGTGAMDATIGMRVT